VRRILGAYLRDTWDRHRYDRAPSPGFDLLHWQENVPQESVVDIHRQPFEKLFPKSSYSQRNTPTVWEPPPRMQSCTLESVEYRTKQRLLSFQGL
jgi:hypothetical protein